MAGEKPNGDEQLSWDVEGASGEKVFDQRPYNEAPITDILLQLAEAAESRQRLVRLTFFSSSAATTPQELFSGHNVFGNLLRQEASFRPFETVLE
jgi:hypothetical protein